MSAFHCDKLCSGECCAPLRSGLATRIHGPLSNKGHDDCPILRATGAAIIEACDRMRAAYAAIDDPAKLAELLAMALRARGSTWAAEADDDDAQNVLIYQERANGCSYRSVPLSTARAALAAIMATPADPSSRERCERIIRGES